MQKRASPAGLRSLERLALGWHLGTWLVNSSFPDTKPSLNEKGGLLCLDGAYNHGAYAEYLLSSESLELWHMLGRGYPG